jgi:hypothetical protein
MPPVLVPGSETRPVRHRYSPMLSRLPSFFVLLVRMYYTYLYFYICKYTRKFVSLHSHIPAPPAATSWGS